MDVYDALRDMGIRLVAGDKWLTLDGYGVWQVYQRKYKQKRTRLLYEGESEFEAIQIFMKEGK